MNDHQGLLKFTTMMVKMRSVSAFVLIALFLSIAFIPKGCMVTPGAVTSQESTPGIVVFQVLIDRDGCIPWSSYAAYVTMEVASNLEVPNITVVTNDVGTLGGFLKRLRYGAEAPCVLALDEQGDINGVISWATSEYDLRRQLNKLTAGEGTVANLRSRLQANPGDTNALWKMAMMQYACSVLGSHELTRARIRQLDPEHLTIGGEYEYIMHCLYEFRGNLSDYKGGTLPGRSELQAVIKGLTHTGPRRLGSLELGKIAAKAGRFQTARDCFIRAWDDREAESEATTAIQVVQSPAWPNEDRITEGSSWEQMLRVADYAMSSRHEKPARE